MKERYDDPTKSEAFRRGFRLADRVKQISKGFRIDTRVSLQRFVAESILWGLSEVSRDDFMVTGGLLHDQRRRQTGDADIRFESRRSAPAIYRDLKAASDLLREHGLLWIPGEVQPMSMGGRGTGYRVPVRCTLGATRVDTHIDISFGALPEGAERKEFKSLYKGPSFAAWAQPLEAQVADKYAAIITLGAENTRLKDYRDLLQLHAIDLDMDLIARSLVSTMRERGADTSLLLGIPDGLSFEYADSRMEEWRKKAAQHGGLPLDFLDVVCTLRHWQADITDRMIDLASRDELEPRKKLDAPSIVPDERGVYVLDTYRRMRA